VVTAGLQEFPHYGSGGAITDEQIESSKRRDLSVPSHCPRQVEKSWAAWQPLVPRRPLSTVRNGGRYLERFQQIATQKTSGIGAVAGGISEALVTTAFGCW